MQTNTIRLSISEAAKMFGIDQKTIRRAISQGHLRYVVVRGKYKITFESLLQWSQQRPRIQNKLSQQGIGQHVSQWKINNRLYSPNPERIKKEGPVAQEASQTPSTQHDSFPELSNP